MSSCLISSLIIIDNPIEYFHSRVGGGEVLHAAGLGMVFYLSVLNRVYKQHAKKVVSDSPGLVDFAIGLVFFVLNLPDGQVLYFGEIQITEGLLTILPIKKGFGAS